MEREEIIKRAKAYIAEETDKRFSKEVQDLLDKEDFKELEDRFYQTLEFGTGGLRGIMGGGTNRMNTLEVRRATQGLANYALKAFSGKKSNLKAVVAYDSRNNSDVFALETALIFAANGIKAYLFSGVRPTPELSYAMIKYGADVGVVVTASHNPREYNGYKAYWNNGAQVIEPHDVGIIDEVNKVSTVKSVSKEAALSNKTLEIIDEAVDAPFCKMCEEQIFRPALIKEMSKTVKIVYTPLHGTGAMPVERSLSALGFSVITVPEQREPNGNFPTVAKPNPEEAPAMKMAVALGEKEHADCVMATDPDADRFGTAFPDKNGKFVLLTGNQMGALMIEYILLSRKELGLMKKDPFMVRSIVTSPFGDFICKKYNIPMIECLTGFKWIANTQEKIDGAGKGYYIFGLEESYGYKVERDTMDKNGISAAVLCAEMTVYWRSKGKSILEHLDEMYKDYGYFEDSGISKYFPGPTGGATMKGIMTKLRTDSPKTLGGKTVLKVRDVEQSVEFDPAKQGSNTALDLPKSNVLQFFLEGGTIVSARPSGTEPKIKFYINTRTEVGNGGLDGAKQNAKTLISGITNEINKTLEV